MNHSLSRRQTLRIAGGGILGTAGVLGTASVGRARPIPASRVFVHPAASADRRDAAAAVTRNGGEVVYAYHSFPFVAASVPTSRIDALRGERRVRLVEADGDMHLHDHKEGHAKESKKEKGPEKGTCTDQPDQEPTWGYRRINAEAAHDYATGAGVNVAVIDSGIQSDHCDLAGGVAPGTWSHKKSTSSEDSGYHGTHVAGIVGARKNGIGVVGVAPDVALHPVKIFDQGSTKESDVLYGLDWCIQRKIEIISMSFGAKNASEALVSAIRVAYAAGHLMVASAGNNGNDQDGLCEKDTVNDYPAKLPEVIAVSAMADPDRGGYQLASFSSVGPAVELMAPGMFINSTVPVNSYGVSHGTSMACPFVSGAAALAWERLGANGPDVRTRDIVRRALRDSAEEVLGVPCEEGYGLVRPDRLVTAL